MLRMIAMGVLILSVILLGLVVFRKSWVLGG